MLSAGVRMEIYYGQHPYTYIAVKFKRDVAAMVDQIVQQTVYQYSLNP